MRTTLQDRSDDLSCLEGKPYTMRVDKIYVQKINTVRIRNMLNRETMIS